jgi:hypothetical protein
LQGAAPPTTNFQERDWLVHEIFEMPLINGKVVLPFMNNPLVVGEEV